MFTQFNTGFQQDHQNRMHDLNNSFSSMYQPHPQDPASGHNSSYFEPPYDRYQMSSGQINQSFFDNLSNTETWMNQSIAPLSASAELYQGILDVEVPYIRPATIQCDPWCSAAMNRQVHSSDMPSRDHALAKCGANRFEQPLDATIVQGLDLPIIHFECSVADVPGCVPSLPPRTTPLIVDLAGSTHPNHGSRMAMPETRVKDDQLHQTPWGSAGIKNYYDKVHASWDSSSTSPCARPLIPKGSGTITGLDLSGLVPYGNGEQDHRSKRASKADRWPSGYLLPFPETPAKDDHRDGILLGVASPNCLSDLAYTPWNDNTMSLNPFPPVPKDDGAFLGLGGSGFAPHGDREQSHTLTGGLEAENWPYRYHVPVGCMPARRSNPRRKRRRFTDGEKAVISHKRKIGVCGDCREAKRKCTHVQVGIGNEATGCGVGAIKTRPQGPSILDGIERQIRNIQEEGL